MVTKQRPVVGPMRSAAFAYINGQFYWELDGLHSVIAQYLSKYGFSEADLYSGAWGNVNNWSQTEVPEYELMWGSDYVPSNPQSQPEAQEKLERLFPNITIKDGRRMGNWTVERFSATMDGMSALSLIQEQVDNDPAAKTAYQALSNAGGTVYVVGGAVRDAVLGARPKDIDLMCAGLNDEQITAALGAVGRLDFTGKQFGVYRFKTQGSEVEIALPRTEQSTGSGHKDFEITADPYLNPEEDLARRDFTGNAMAYNPVTQELLDPHAGAEDLKNGNLKLVNDNAFRDDPLRIVRALVAQARFGLVPDEKVIQAMKDNAQQIRHLPGERVQMEMDKLLAAKDPAVAIETAFDTGLVEYIAPELASIQGFDQQNPHHDLPVDQHTLAVLRKAAQLTNDPDVRLAALFHDSGKPDSFWRDETLPEGNGGHFYKKVNDDGTTIGENHEDVGAQYARAFMERLRYPTARTEHVVTLVQEHMFPPFQTAAGARKFINKFGGNLDMVFDMLNLREADSSGKRDGNMSPKDAEIMHKMRTLIQEEVDRGSAFTIKDLAINGKDLIAAGYKPGPEIGRVLKDIMDQVIENPELNDHDTLMGMIPSAV